MIINKKSSLYKINYGWSCKKPDEITLWKFWGRTILSILIIWPLYYPSKPVIWILKIIFWILLRTIGTVIAFVFFGYKPVRWTDSQPPFEPIKRWPKYKGRHIKPWEIIFLSAVIIFLCAFYIYVFIYQIGYIEVYQNIILQNPETFYFCTAFFGTIIGAVLLGELGKHLYQKAKKSKSWKVCKKHLNSKVHFQ